MLLGLAPIFVQHAFMSTPQTSLCNDAGDKFEGQGQYEYVDGSTYVGEWKAGKKHGQVSAATVLPTVWCCCMVLLPTVCFCCMALLHCQPISLQKAAAFMWLAYMLQPLLGSMLAGLLLPHFPYGLCP